MVNSQWWELPSIMLKNQDILGIFSSVGITSIAVLLVFSGNMMSEDMIQKQVENTDSWNWRNDRH